MPANGSLFPPFRQSGLERQVFGLYAGSGNQALEGEREKYRLGAGQLVDVLTMEDRLTVAQQTLVSAELGYALALAQLRFATGSIVAPDKTVQAIDREVFFTVPVPAAKKPPG